MDSFTFSMHADKKNLQRIDGAEEIQNSRPCQIIMQIDFVVSSFKIIISIILFVIVLPSISYKLGECRYTSH